MEWYAMVWTDMDIMDILPCHIHTIVSIPEQGENSIDSSQAVMQIAFTIMIRVA